jgi:hypothetical protein
MRTSIELRIIKFVSKTKNCTFENIHLKIFKLDKKKKYFLKRTLNKLSKKNIIQYNQKWRWFIPKTKNCYFCLGNGFTIKNIDANTKVKLPCFKCKGTGCL